MADDVAEDEEYEEQAIKYLFYRGFEYEEMRGLLFEEFGIKMSLSTLKRRLKALNLARKQRDNVKQVIEELLDGPHSCVGYLSILHESSAHFYIFKSSINKYSIACSSYSSSSVTPSAILLIMVYQKVFRPPQLIQISDILLPPWTFDFRRGLLLPPQLRFSVVPWLCRLCRNFVDCAMTFSGVPWLSRLCLKIGGYAVGFIVVPWDSYFCRDTRESFTIQIYYWAVDTCEKFRAEVK